MYTSLYRRYRPQQFSEVVGQQAAIGVITRAIQNDTVGHAYLFSGPRGCGKTTVARLLAKAVNCTDRHGAEPCNACDNCKSIVQGNCLDVIEIDGASNNSVDEIRDLKEHVALASFTCPYKIYIIDEVHMLSISAFNALLKTLEEPPERVIFILATTAPHKVPVTIRSRCQHIPFHGMTPEQIVQRLQYICTKEELQSEDEALWEIARNSEGGMRDALSLMEQAIAYAEKNITRATIARLLGGGSSSSIRAWLTTCHKTPENALPELENLFRTGAVPERFLTTLFTSVRNLWLQSRWGENVLKKLSLSQEERDWLRQERDLLSRDHLEHLMAQIASLLPQVRRGLSNDVLSGLLIEWILQDSPLPATRPEINHIASHPVHTSAQPQGPYGAIERGAPQPAATEHRPPHAPTPSGEGSAAHVPPAPGAPRTAATSAEQGNARTSSRPETAAAAPKAAPETVSGTSAETGAPAAEQAAPAPDIPDTSNLTLTDDKFTKLLTEQLHVFPQVVIPLRLADVVYEPDQNVVTVILPADETGAFEALNSSHAAQTVSNLVERTGRSPLSVMIHCGSETKSYPIIPLENVFTLTPAPPVPPSAGKVAVPPAPAAGAAATATPDPSSSRRATAATSTPAATTASRTSAAPQNTLAALIDDILEGELLYYRPNQAPEETDEDQDE